MGASKAIAGGVAGGVVMAMTDVVMWALAQIPIVQTMPENVIGSLAIVVGAAIGFVSVYLAPANGPAKSE